MQDPTGSRRAASKTVAIQETTVFRVSPEGQFGAGLSSYFLSKMIRQAKDVGVRRKLKISNSQRSDANQDLTIPTGLREGLIFKCPSPRLLAGRFSLLLRASIGFFPRGASFSSFKREIVAIGITSDAVTRLPTTRLIYVFARGADDAYL
jgi:hypothetical protein